MDSSNGLNVGDVTGPRWAGGTRNPEKRETVAERAWREHPDEMARAHTELQVGVLREQLAAAEAAKADAWDEGYAHAYKVGVQEGATGRVVEYVAPNPYRPERAAALRSGTERSGQ